MIPNAAMIHSARVGRPDRDPVTLVDAELGERARSATNPFGDFDEVRAQRTVDDRLGVAESVRCAQDHLGDGLPTVSVPVTP